MIDVIGFRLFSTFVGATNGAFHQSQHERLPVGAGVGDSEGSKFHGINVEQTEDE